MPPSVRNTSCGGSTGTSSKALLKMRAARTFVRLRLKTTGQRAEGRLNEGVGCARKRGPSGARDHC